MQDHENIALEFDAVSFCYPHQARALNNVSFAVRGGEHVSIVGGNGSGKSTLAKHINGLLVPSAGCVRVFGSDTHDSSALGIIRSSVGFVFQNPDDQIVASIIEDEVAFGPENLGIDPTAIRARVDDALDRVGLAGFNKTEVQSLSGGQKQRVAIAGALAMNPRILVFDEADSMLDPAGRNELQNIIDDLSAQGMTIVSITHSMEAAVQADKVGILCEGCLVSFGTPEDAFLAAGGIKRYSLQPPFAEQVRSALRCYAIDIDPCLTDEALGCALSKALRPGAAPNAKQNGKPTKTNACAHARNAAHATEAETAVALEDVWHTYEPRPRTRGKGQDTTAWSLEGVSLSVRRGEVFGIAGHTGSGKSTLIQHINALVAPCSGRVIVEGWDVNAKGNANRARSAVGLLFQYPEHQLFAQTVFDDIAFGPRNFGYSHKETDSAVHQSLARVGLNDPKLESASPFSLSGGTQRRVALAGVLATNPRILVLDEPTAGLDPQSRASFITLIDQLNREEGITVIIVSHDMDLLAQRCNRIAVMSHARIHSVGTPAEIFSDEEECAHLGIGVPRTLSVARQLASCGLISTCPNDVFTPESLAHTIANQLS